MPEITRSCYAWKPTWQNIISQLTRKFVIVHDEEKAGFGRSVVLTCWLPEKFDRLKAAPIAVMKAFLYLYQAMLFFVILAKIIYQFLHQCFSETV
jgi:hypothetical protein